MGCLVNIGWSFCADAEVRACGVDLRASQRWGVRVVLAVHGRGCGRISDLGPDRPSIVVERQLGADSARAPTAPSPHERDGRRCPTLGHAARPIPTAALSQQLLSSSEVGAVMGASLSVTNSSHGLYENEQLEDGCLVWAEAQRHTYEGSGWTAVRVQELLDRPGNADHIVY